jgi:hypothetical protein
LWTESPESALVDKRLLGAFKLFSAPSLSFDHATLDLDGLDVPSYFASASGLILLVSRTALELALVAGRLLVTFKLFGGTSLGSCFSELHEIIDAMTLSVPLGKGGKFAIIVP